MTKDIKIKRVYDTPSASDGKRILVDRLWPRGLSKDKAKIDLWIKEIAPSTELRKWFNHDTAKWSEFQTKFQAELKSNTEAVKRLQTELDENHATLVYSAHDSDHNNAVVIKNFLEKL